VTTDGCGPLLAYDYTHDTLWTCHGYRPATLRASDGSLVPSCAQNVGGFWDDNHSIGTWTFGAPSDLYVYMEDDISVHVYDPTTCTWKATYTHRAVSEPANEDEEMACDPLTYGPDSALKSLGQWTAALWMRDADISSMTPYAIPNGFCPLPTTTTYTGTPRTSAGATVNLCATIEHVYPGGSLALVGMPATFTLAGPVSVTVPGIAHTLGDGTGCLPWTATIPPGTYSVTAAYDPAAAHRAAQYLPSRGEGSLIVTPKPTLPRPSNALPGVAPFAALGPPEPPAALQQPIAQPVPNAASQLQAEVQAQAQAQAQSQGQAQAASQAQPGLMVQRRTQEQVATQTAPLGQTQSGPLLAVRHQPRSPAAGVELIVGSMLLALGFVARRPATAIARLRQRTRRL
jgi:hypothetical protein